MYATGFDHMLPTSEGPTGVRFAKVEVQLAELLPRQTYESVIAGQV
jgi:hypothetical protein